MPAARRTALDAADCAMITDAVRRDYPVTTPHDDIYQLNGHYYVELPCRAYQPDEVLIVRATIHDRDNAESVAVLTVELEEVGKRYPDMDVTDWTDDQAEEDHQ